MRVLILGGDGYLGWPTALRFSAGGHEVSVVDNFIPPPLGRGRRQRLADPDREPRGERIAAWEELSGEQLPAYVGAVEDGEFLDRVVAETRPEAVIHYGEQASAPYSMASREQAVETQYGNVIGNLNLLFAIRDHVPECHLVKLGTMGEYGQPNIDIEEGYIEIEHKGRTRQPALPEAARLALSLLEGPRLDQHPLRLPHLGPARHRPQSRSRLRNRHPGDCVRRAPHNPL